MAKLMRHNWPLVGLIIVLGGIVYALFPDLFACPSCYLFVDGADGLKNYFTPAWFVEHDPGLWFHGMNYPYGEHIVYTDNQPSWSVSMKAVDQLFPMGAHVTGTINMLVILSLFACGILLYYVMRELGLPRWYAALVSLPLTLLSPQIARIGGHYSLAHTFHLPLFILLFIRWTRTRSFWRSVWLILAVVWMGFTHLYYLLIAVSFLTSYAVVILGLSRFRLLRQAVLAVMIAGVAGICVFATVKLTDPVVDRPSDVWGLYIFSAKAEGTFLPWYEPLGTIWEDRFSVKRPDFEGMSYVGVPVTLLLIPVFVWLVRRITKRRRRRVDPEAWLHDPATLLLTAVLVWLYASSWLLSLGGEQLIDVFPVLGQFRSLGRLAWIFYYISGLAVVYWSYLQIRRSKGTRRYWLWGAMGLLFILWCVDACGFVRQHIRQDYPRNTIFKGSTPFADLLGQASKGPRTYQAVLSLPMVAVGSEKINVDRGMWVMRMGMQCAWETGLPLVNSNMSRSSVSQALSLLQLLSDPEIEKERLADMDGRPLLLLTSGPQNLTEAERRLVGRAQRIGRAEYVDVYALPVSAFYQDQEKTDYSDVLHLSFDEHPAEHAMDGSGAFYSDTSFTRIYTMPDTFSTDTLLRYSSWSYIGPHGPFFPVIRHQVVAPSGALIHDQDYSMFSFDPHNVRGSWVETAFDFRVRGDSSKHIFILQSDHAWIDELNIRRRE